MQTAEEAVEPLVAGIMKLIDAGADDPRLRWSPDRATVRVVFSRLILDSEPRADPLGRRPRFGDAWRAAMVQRGWVPTAQAGTFTRPAATSFEAVQAHLSEAGGPAQPAAGRSPDSHGDRGSPRPPAAGFSWRQ
jgi:hypothetical protein